MAYTMIKKEQNSKSVTGNLKSLKKTIKINKVTVFVMPQNVVTADGRNIVRMQSRKNDLKFRT